MHTCTISILIAPSLPDAGPEMNTCRVLPGTLRVSSGAALWEGCLFGQTPSPGRPILEDEDENIKLENHLLSRCFGFVTKMDEQDPKRAKMRKQLEMHFG